MKDEGVSSGSSFILHPSPFTMIQAVVSVTENVLIAQDTYRIRLRCPELATVIRPGQFVMLRLPNATDPLLGRPFALYDTVLDGCQKPSAVDIVYLVVGKMTRLLRHCVRVPRSKFGGRWVTVFPG